MHINRELNLVMKWESEKFGSLYIHSCPVSESVLDAYPKELCLTLDELMGQVRSTQALYGATQVAYSMLKNIATNRGTWSGAGGVEAGFVNEILRLTNVLYVGENGWEVLPVDVSIKKGILSERDKREILSNILFFMLNFSLCPREYLPLVEEFLNFQPSLERTSSNCMEFLTGLQTSNKNESFGEKEKE